MDCGYRDFMDCRDCDFMSPECDFRIAFSEQPISSDFSPRMMQTVEIAGRGVSPRSDFSDLVVL